MAETPLPQLPTKVEFNPFDLKTCSTSELLFYLKTSFTNKDYVEVERVITQREIKVKQDKAEIERKYQDLLKEFGILKKLQKHYIEELGTEVTRRQDLEDENAKKGREIAVMVENIARLEREKEKIGRREKLAEERVRELNVEIDKVTKEKNKEIDKVTKKKNEEIAEIMGKNKKLEMENRKCRTENEAWRKKMEEWDERVSNLDNDYQVLADAESNRKSMNRSELGVDSGGTTHVGKQMERLESNLKCREPVTPQSVPESDHPKVRATSSQRFTSKRDSTDIIDITDSDEEVCPSKLPKMKKKDDILSSNYKMKELEVLTPGSSKQSSTRAARTTQNGCEEVKAVGCTPGVAVKSGFRGSKILSEYDSSDYEGEILRNPLFQKLLTGSGKDGECKTWEFEADMLEALEGNSELCMKAVCALHKCKALNSLNVFRGKTLAEFLVGGDPEGGLKKSVTELLQYDPRGFDDCKRIAIAHSRQLFDIYKKKSDPLFVP